MNIVYKGPANFQIFNKADFAKADIDQGKLTFERDVPQEVEDEVGEALTSTDPEESPIFHDFPFEVVDEPTGEEDPEPKVKKGSKKSKKAVDQRVEGQGSQGSTSSDSPSGNTGAGTSGGTTTTTGARSTGGSTT